jgi:outer membrane protein with beta-barrel domain
MPSRARHVAALVLLTGAVAGSPTPLHAQDHPSDKKPIGRFAADARGAFPKFKLDPTVAAAVGVAEDDLPGRGLGFAVGAHVYPVRFSVVALGIGAEMMMARASHTVAAATNGAAPGPTVNARFATLAPQVSFNFGRRDGWSYISGGIGFSRFTVEREDRPLPDQEARSKTINYGGGARWFSKKHIALSVDLRFYAVNPQEATTTRPALPRMTFSAFSVGASFK